MGEIVGVGVDDGTLGVRVWAGWKRAGVERREEKSLEDATVDVGVCGVNWVILLLGVVLVDLEIWGGTRVSGVLGAYLFTGFRMEGRALQRRQSIV